LPRAYFLLFSLLAASYNNEIRNSTNPESNECSFLPISLSKFSHQPLDKSWARHRVLLLNIRLRLSTCQFPATI
jgi:hypothetical protein